MTRDWFNPNSSTPATEQWVAELHRRARQTLLREWVGYAVLTGAILGSAAMLLSLLLGWLP